MQTHPVTQHPIPRLPTTRRLRLATNVSMICAMWGQAKVDWPLMLRRMEAVR